MASGRAFGIRAARSGAGGAGRKLTQFRLARFPRPHAPSPRPAPWAILFRPAGWGSVLAYLLRTDSRVFLRNPQSRHFRSRTLASGVLTRNGDLSSLGGPLAGERACLGRAAARLMTPEGVIAGRKARPHGGGANSSGGRKRLPKPFAAGSPRRLSTRPTGVNAVPGVSMIIPFTGQAGRPAPLVCLLEMGTCHLWAVRWQAKGPA